MLADSTSKLFEMWGQWSTDWSGFPSVQCTTKMSARKRKMSNDSNAEDDLCNEHGQLDRTLDADLHRWVEWLKSKLVSDAKPSTTTKLKKNSFVCLFCEISEISSVVSCNYIFEGIFSLAQSPSWTSHCSSCDLQKGFCWKISRAYFSCSWACQDTLLETKVFKHADGMINCDSHLMLSGFGGSLALGST